VKSLPKNNAGRAFTLIELLVAVACIAILAALMLPALVKARASGNGARCLSNLRQLGYAAHMYWNDYNGTAFVERADYTNGGWRYWFGWLQDGAEGQRDFDPQPGPLWPYLRGRGVEVCPSLNTFNPYYKPKARGAAYGYGYNLLVGTRETEGIRIGLAAAPSRLGIFADCAQINDFLAPASPTHPMLEEFYYFDTNSASATVHFRHRERSQVWFVDGHAGGEHLAPGSKDDRLPPELVGRLNPAIIMP
jgi:prepilin-type N-terminal cleavage/methylation domain-containing protein/prepilin-type processing-associated H-X9-DG protein